MLRLARASKNQKNLQALSKTVINTFAYAVTIYLCTEAVTLTTYETNMLDKLKQKHSMTLKGILFKIKAKTSKNEDEDLSC